MDVCRSSHLECFDFVDDGKDSSKRWRISCIYAFVVDADWVYWTKGLFSKRNKGTNVRCFNKPVMPIPNVSFIFARYVATANWELSSPVMESWGLPGIVTIILHISGLYIFRQLFERSSFTTSGGTFVNFAYSVTKLGVIRRRDRIERIGRSDDPIASTANSTLKQSISTVSIVLGRMGKDKLIRGSEERTSSGVTTAMLGFGPI